EIYNPRFLNLSIYLGNTFIQLSARFGSSQKRVRSRPLFPRLARTGGGLSGHLKSGHAWSPENRPCKERSRTLTAAGGSVAFRGMANVLNNEKKQQILALRQLGWSLRRIQE